MKIVAINGSHRKGKSTATMLKFVLEEVALAGGETELIELIDYNISLCKSCNRCLIKTECSITDDDMGIIAEKMLAADGIILGSPVYFGNVSGLMKIFIDRTRWMHMYKNMLEGKVGAAVAHAGLRNGGQEMTVLLLERFLLSQGLRVVEARLPESGIYNLGAMGTMFERLDGDNITWKADVEEDLLAIKMCRNLGRNLVKIISGK